VESGVERLLSGIHIDWLVMAGNVIPKSFQEAAFRYVLQTRPVVGESGAPADRFAVGATIG
jgi:hypothetical protein